MSLIKGKAGLGTLRHETGPFSYSCLIQPLVFMFVDGGAIDALGNLRTSEFYENRTSSSRDQLHHLR